MWPYGSNREDLVKMLLPLSNAHTHTHTHTPMHTHTYPYSGAA